MRCAWRGRHRANRILDGLGGILLWRDERVEYLTAEHSLENDVAGEGRDVELAVRALGWGDGAAEYASVDLRDGDVLLLCTRSTRRAVKPDELAEALRHDRAGSTERLVDAALAARAEGASAVMVRVQVPCE